MIRTLRTVLATLALTTAATPHLWSADPLWRFDLGDGPAVAGWRKVGPGAVFDASTGYGFHPGAKITAVDRGGADPLGGDFCTSDGPFLFSAVVPEGNYLVTLTLGDPQQDALVTIKSEAHQLQVLHLATAKGEVVKRTIAVSVRTPQLPGGNTVGIKPREQSSLRWDNRLTLEFADTRPCIGAIEITPAPELPTIYLAGDSTVVDQDAEPYRGWGQMLPCFFGPGFAVSNHAESGLSARSFLSSRRLDKIRSTLKKGDYLLVQFGHNDQKDKSPGAGAFTNYTEALRTYIAAAREAGATPVLVTSMQRRHFAADGTITPSLGDYPEAMRRLAKEAGITVIDLNAASTSLIEAMGPDASKQAFVYFPLNSFPGQTKVLSDDTHFVAYGAYEMARCVVAGIADSSLSLKSGIVAGLERFDPHHPDEMKAVAIPSSPLTETAKPDGN